MGHAGTNRKSPNGAPWETLNLKLSRPISAPPLTAVQGACGVPAPPLTAVQGTCGVPASPPAAVLSWRYEEENDQVYFLGDVPIFQLGQQLIAGYGDIVGIVDAKVCKFWLVGLIAASTNYPMKALWSSSFECSLLVLKFMGSRQLVTEIFSKTLSPQLGGNWYSSLSRPGEGDEEEKRYPTSVTPSGKSQLISTAVQVTSQTASSPHSYWLRDNVYPEGQDSSVGKSLDLQSKDCRFEPRCRRGVFLVLTFSKPLPPNC